MNESTGGDKKGGGGRGERVQLNRQHDIKYKISLFVKYIEASEELLVIRLTDPFIAA